MPFWKAGREGYIYVIRMIDSPHRFTSERTTGCSYKIGKSTDVPSRYKAIGLIVPYHTRLLIAIETVDMSWAEAYVHRKLTDVRIRGEWFQLTEYHMEWLHNIGDGHFRLMPGCQRRLDDEFHYRTIISVRPDDMPYLGNDSAADLKWDW